MSQSLRLSLPFWSAAEADRTLTIRLVNAGDELLRDIRVCYAWLGDPLPEANELDELFDALRSELGQELPVQQQARSLSVVVAVLLPGQEIATPLRAEDVERLQALVAALPPEQYRVEVRSGVETLATLDGAALAGVFNAA